MASTGIGTAVRRTEDIRFLTGRGRYTDDMNRPGQAHAWFVRSNLAHAKIRSIDTSEAASAPGVLAVLTGEDLKADGVGDLPCGFDPAGSDPLNKPPHPALSRGRVRFVGEQVAVVVAETREQARNAAELVKIDYEELPVVVSAVEAMKDGAPLLHDEAPGNIHIHWQLGDKDATDKAFSAAKHITSLDLVNNRKVPNAIEPRCSIGEYEPSDGSYTLYTTSQNPHVTRLLLAAFLLGVPEQRVRVVSQDMGGGFGSKIPHYPEELVVTWAAKRVRRPVKWTAERSESFLCDTHGRDHVTHAELALDGDGKILGLRAHTTSNLGAYLSTFGALSTTFLYATLLSGQYRIPAIHCHVDGVFTNTAPIDAERGAGRPEATYLVERIVERAARELGMDPTDLRRRNFIPPDAFPYETPVALTYDIGDYVPTLDKALEMIDYKGFEARRKESQSRGRLRGIGLSTYIEACGLAPSNVAGAIGAGVGLYEVGQVRMHPTGTVTVFTGSHSHGQGHETAFAQIVSDRLGVPMENVEVVHGDTGRVSFGLGTYGSRSLAVGGSAVVKSLEKIIAKGRKIAAHLLEASEGDIEFEAGTFKVAGTDKSTTIADVAMAAFVPHNYPLQELEPGLDETSFYDPANFTYPAGCHICELEVDPDTGVVDIVDWVAVDDFGKLVNPMIVEGQIHGGIAHGVGQAMLEQCIYDAQSGQLVTGTYNDYGMPRADHFPDIRTGFTETPCTHNPLGVKGCGEAGAIAAPAAFMNALTHAIGSEDIDMPATPERVWRAVAAARGKAAA